MSWTTKCWYWKISRNHSFYLLSLETVDTWKWTYENSHSFVVAYRGEAHLVDCLPSMFILPWIHVPASHKWGMVVHFNDSSTWEMDKLTLCFSQTRGWTNTSKRRPSTTKTCTQFPLVLGSGKEDRWSKISYILPKRKDSVCNPPTSYSFLLCGEHCGGSKSQIKSFLEDRGGTPFLLILMNSY